MTKYCNGSGLCGYRYQEGSLVGCKYEGYCDYQCPKDSRMQPLQVNPYTMPYLGAEATCPYCHLPLSQCKGHLTCGGGK